MRTVKEILDENWPRHSFYEGAAEEICYLRKHGIWPKYRPNLNSLVMDLIREGYPQDQAENIAINCVKNYALNFLAFGT